MASYSMAAEATDGRSDDDDGDDDGDDGGDDGGDDDDGDDDDDGGNKDGPTPGCLSRAAWGGAAEASRDRKGGQAALVSWVQATLWMGWAPAVRKRWS